MRKTFGSSDEFHNSLGSSHGVMSIGFGVTESDEVNKLDSVARCSEVGFVSYSGSTLLETAPQIADSERLQAARLRPFFCSHGNNQNPNRGQRHL